MPVDCSVILATRDRAAVVADALAALSRQETAGRFTYDVVVVDNGSSDDTKAVVERAQRGAAVRIQYLFEPRAGKSFALNRGITAATGTWLAFTDDDIRAPSDWLATLWRCAAETGAEGIAGRITPEWIGIEPGEETEQIVRHIGTIGCLDFGDTRLQISPSQRRYWWVGGNVAAHRSVFTRHGLFDERLKLVEDGEMFHRLSRRGVHIIYEPAARVRHRVPIARVTPAAVRRWYQDRGRYRVYTVPWRPHHALTLLPLYCYADAARLLGRWVMTVWDQRRRWEHLSCECRLRAHASHAAHRLQLLPAWWQALARGTTRDSFPHLPPATQAQA